MKLHFGRLTQLIPVAAVTPLLLFFVGPFVLYSGNPEEMSVALSPILARLVLPALLLTALLTASGLLVSERFYFYYLSGLLALGLLFWTQSNLLAWDYGLLDGQAIDWSSHPLRWWVDVSVWSFVLCVCLVAAKRVVHQAPKIALGLLIVQVAFVAISTLRSPTAWQTRQPTPFDTPPPEIFQFSSTTNVVHLVLDAFQDDVFAEIVAGNLEKYERQLRGFTLFTNTAGHFPTTYMSVPAYMSGKLYRNEFPARSYVKAVMSGQTISNVLYDDGYEVDLVLGPRFYLDGLYSHQYAIPVPYQGGKQALRLTLSKVLDLTLFRAVPEPVKVFIYNDQLWFLQRLFSDRKEEQLVQFAHLNFARWYASQIQLGSEKPRYKLFHFLTSHAPWMMDEHGAFKEEVEKPSRTGVLEQQQAALDAALAILEQLGNLGVLDSSLVLLHSDHGASPKAPRSEGGVAPPVRAFSNLVGLASPLLAIKPPQASEPMRFSSAQASLSDIPDTVLDLLDLEPRFGKSRLFVDTPSLPSERTFLKHRWRGDYQLDFFDPLLEFRIHGPVDRASSWTQVATYGRPDDPPQPISLLEAASASGKGWNAVERGGKKRLVMRSAAASLQFQPTTQPALLSVRARPQPHQPEREHPIMGVYVDGNLIARWKLRPGFRNYAAYVTSRPGARSNSVLEFRLDKSPNPAGSFFLFDKIELLRSTREKHTNRASSNLEVEKENGPG